MEKYIMVKHNLLMPVREPRYHAQIRNCLLRSSNYLLRVSNLE